MLTATQILGSSKRLLKPSDVLCPVDLDSLAERIAALSVRANTPVGHEFRGNQWTNSNRITDPVAIQEKRNSINEGRLILRTGKINGRKLSPDELLSIRKQIERDLDAIGESRFAKPYGSPHFTISDVTPVGYGPSVTASGTSAGATLGWDTRHQWQPAHPEGDPAGLPSGKIKHAVLVIGGKRWAGHTHGHAMDKFLESGGRLRNNDSIGFGFQTESGHYLNRDQAEGYQGESDAARLRLAARDGQLYTQDAVQGTHVAEYQRHTPSGGVATVREHEDSRIIHESSGSLWGSRYLYSIVNNRPVVIRIADHQTSRQIKGGDWKHGENKLKEASGHEYHDDVTILHHDPEKVPVHHAIAIYKEALKKDEEEYEHPAEIGELPTYIVSYNAWKEKPTLPDAHGLPKASQGQGHPGSSATVHGAEQVTQKPLSRDFNCGENEIQASLINFASAGATPAPATILARLPGLSGETEAHRLDSEPRLATSPNNPRKEAEAKHAEAVKKALAVAEAFALANAKEKDEAKAKRRREEAAALALLLLGAAGAASYALLAPHLLRVAVAGAPSQGPLPTPSAPSTMPEAPVPAVTLPNAPEAPTPAQPRGIAVSPPQPEQAPVAEPTPEQVADMLDGRTLEKAAEDFADERAEFLKPFCADIQEAMRLEVEVGKANGESIHQIGRRLFDLAQGVYGSRGAVLAATEAQSAYGHAQLRALAAAGYRTANWIQVDRETKRASHAENVLAGPLPIGDTWPNGQKFPGDPIGGPGECINCLCELAGADWHKPKPERVLTRRQQLRKERLVKRNTAKASEPATGNTVQAGQVGQVNNPEGHNQFTVERMEGSDLKPHTFSKGELVSVFFSHGNFEHGELVGISHKNRTARVKIHGPTGDYDHHHSFGGIYKYNGPEIKPDKKKDLVSVEKAIESVNKKNEPEGGWSDADRVPKSFQNYRSKASDPSAPETVQAVHIKEYERKTKSGGVAEVQEHEDRRTKQSAPVPMGQVSDKAKELAAGVTWKHGGEKSESSAAKAPQSDKADIQQSKDTSEAKSDRVQRAKDSHHLTERKIQQYAEEHNEPAFAKSIGGAAFRDNEAVDIVLADDTGHVAHGIELKTVISNKANKITMKREALARKRSWERKNKATIHTVVLDDTLVFNAKGNGKHDLTQRKIYYRRGYGSFRLGSMYQVKDLDELKSLLTIPKRSLPKGAK